MAKKVIIHINNNEPNIIEIEERVTVINDKLAWSIDTSVLNTQRRLIINDENNRAIAEYYLSQNTDICIMYI